MTRSNLEQEEEWLEAWSEIYELSAVHLGLVYLDPEGGEISQDEALAWLQAQAYASRRVGHEVTKHKGQTAVQVCSWGSAQG